MIRDGELTYWEYWLTKPVWDVRTAIQFVVDHIKLKRGWSCSDNVQLINESLHDQIKRDIVQDRVKHVFKKVNVTRPGYDHEAGVWEEERIILEESDVDPRLFLEWLHVKGYPLPYEFKAFIGIEEKEDKITQRAEERMDREACQAVARTLWDREPSMTIEEMQYSRAIQIYASGKRYSTDTTLRRWIREVDTRETKTGPKKKE